MLFLMWRDLRHRRWRSLGVVALLAIVMTLLFLMSGLVGQFRAEPLLATERVGGSHDWILAERSTGPFTSGRAFPADTVSDVDGIPVLIGRVAAEGDHVFLVGRSFDQLDEPRLTTGRHPSGDDEVVVDSSLGLPLGQTFQLGARAVTVVGLTDDATVLAGVPLVFGSLPLAQATVAAGNDLVSGVLVPPEADQPLPDGVSRFSAASISEDSGRPLEDAIGSVNLVRGLLWLITIIVIGAVTYIAALERTRDVAVLKAVGVPERAIALDHIGQAVLLTVAAVAVAAVLQQLAQPLFPLTIRIPAATWWQIPVAAVLVGALAGLTGVRRSASVPAREAFA